MQKFKSPFFHILQDNFLSKEDYKKIKSIHSKTLFIEKQTDLFHFNQSQELVDIPELSFFKDKLMKFFKNLTKREGSLNIFASYYKDKNYLLCHDDMVDERKYAFTFYLDDCESGNLILYENDAITENKRIQSRENRIVVFEVSPISFHEVDICVNEVRRAYTGWFSYSDKIDQNYEKEDKIDQNYEKEDKIDQNYEKEHKIDNDTKNNEIDSKSENIGRDSNEDIKKYNKFTQQISDVFNPLPSGIEYSPLEIETDEPTIVENVEFEIEGGENIEGPFTSRRLLRITPNYPVAFSINGLKLLEMNFYRLRKGDYILINDKINSIGTKINSIETGRESIETGRESKETGRELKETGREFSKGNNQILKIYDIFILKSISKLPINYVKDGSIEFTIHLENNTLYFVERGVYDIFIERCFDEHVLAHFIYSNQ
ncbi:Prolyl 3-hydroxylase OGFOD1 [Dictyocoela muelleri]|nr:Prolyl 3-hydroxylase OGFOD1 [Dictyocoela muelleri]